MILKNKNFWMTLLLILCGLIPFGMWMRFGGKGFFSLINTEMEQMAYVEKINKLTKENQALLDEINRLRTDREYMESVVRKELSLVADNELVYRFSSEESDDNF